MANGWIKLHRCLTDWEWYDDPNTFRVFMHILLTANHEAKQWHGHTIEAGQKITSVGHLAEETGLSVRNVRTALDHLKATGELTIKPTNKFSLITVENWGKYQGADCETDKQSDKRATNNRQTTDKQPTTNKNEKNIKNEKKYSENPNLDTAFKSYIEHRKQLKKPMTDNAIKLAMKKLTQLADNDKDRIAIIEESIANGWQGLFALKKDQPKPEEVKPKKYKEFKPVKEVAKTGMPEEMKKKLGGMFNYE